MKTLGDVKVGESSTIVKLHGEGALRRHLMDLGLIKGTSFKVVKVAPLGVKAIDTAPNVSTVGYQMVDSIHCSQMARNPVRAP